MNSSTAPQAIFESRIAAIHWRANTRGDFMDVRHEEFMAMAEAFLGPGYDGLKLAQVEAEQVALHIAQANLAKELESHRIGRPQYLEKVHLVHAETAARCESILGSRDFSKLFGMTASEVGPCIDEETFQAQLLRYGTT